MGMVAVRRTARAALAFAFAELAFAALVAANAFAIEQTARVERVELVRAGAELVADLELAALFSPPVENTLRSGLPVVVDLAVELRPAAGRSSGRLVRSTLSYDVWEDRYRLERGGRHWDYPDLAALRAAGARYEALPLATLAALGAPASLTLSLRVAVDPLGGAERERMERWLARTVSDPVDPSARELRLDLGALLGSVFGGKGEQGWGPERVFGPFALTALPERAAAPAPAAPAAPPPATPAAPPADPPPGAGSKEGP
jgi:hypothetical protein